MSDELSASDHQAEYRRHSERAALWQEIATVTTRLRDKDHDEKMPFSIWYEPERPTPEANAAELGAYLAKLVEWEQYLEEDDE